ncbi:GNAT family N-acetyltransferase [Leucobacter japonicus]|uniref:GNAT family N-acetyltransferase n=1 Tax=Leucobacter japonicus TaxID=1461259 RepID=UPI0006A7D007|nr:GNAT family N-acetyltransferase [Leucobacter japonicus]
MSFTRVVTERLVLRRPVDADIDALHTINADPEGWRFFSVSEFARRAETEAQLERWAASWHETELGTWIAETVDSAEVVGYGGCTRLLGDPTANETRNHAGDVWNLGYRFAVDHRGRGFATEMSRAAVAAAIAANPTLPVVAFLLEGNHASATVAEKVGLTLRHRAHDAGNPDPDAVRRVYADRALTSKQLATVLR